MSQIIFPRASGGNWISNLIWHLEHGDFTVPQVQTVFDGQPLGSVPVSHLFEIHNPHQPEQVSYYQRSKNDIIFSCRHLFNHYLNNVVKIKYHLEQIHTQSEQAHIFGLSNAAQYYLGNTHYKDHYCGHIDLDYSRIFTDPDQFVQDFYAVLNKLNVRFIENTDYVLRSMEYYRSTCSDPADHYDNFDSMLWLGCCHAIALLDQLTIPGLIVDKSSAQQLLKPYAAHCRDRIRPIMFEWKK